MGRDIVIHLRSVFLDDGCKFCYPTKGRHVLKYEELQVASKNPPISCEFNRYKQCEFKTLVDVYVIQDPRKSIDIVTQSLTFSFLCYRSKPGGDYET